MSILCFLNLSAIKGNKIKCLFEDVLVNYWPSMVYYWPEVMNLCLEMVSNIIFGELSVFVGIY